MDDAPQRQRHFNFEALDEIGLGFATGVFRSIDAIPYRFASPGLGPLIELGELIAACA